MATVAKPTTPTKISVPPIVPRIAPREDLNPFRIAQIQFDMAAEFLKLDPGLRQILRTPKRVLEVSLPTKMDNGQVKVFTGYRVQHNISRGPGKGGIRYHPNLTLDEVKALAVWMTWKTATVTAGAPARRRRSGRRRPVSRTPDRRRRPPSGPRPPWASGFSRKRSVHQSRSLLDLGQRVTTGTA